MRHGCKVNHLSRTHAHRVAMLSNMATSLILNKRVETTLAKAKALRVYVEPLITRSKEDTTNNRRVVFSYLHSKEAVNERWPSSNPSTTTRTCISPSPRRKPRAPVVAVPRRPKPLSRLPLLKPLQPKKPPRLSKFTGLSLIKGMRDSTYLGIPFFRVPSAKQCLPPSVAANPVTNQQTQ